MILLLLCGVGGGAWWFTQAPASTPITLEVRPFEKTTLQIAGASPIAGKGTQIVNLTGTENIVVRHPDLPVWRGTIHPESLPQKKFLINLEKSAPQHSLKVLSNSSKAEVWVYGVLRGETPFTGNIPLSTRGTVYVEVRSTDNQTRSKTLARKGNKPLFYYAKF